MDNVLPLPFEDDTSLSYSVRACMQQVNLMLKWKAKGPDATGSVFNIDDQADRLSTALGILLAHGLVNQSQVDAIIKHLQNG